MKISWLSNAPWTPTGYGQQTRLFAPLIRDAGYDIAITASWGLAGDQLTWEGIPVYPGGFDAYGNDIMVPWALEHFEGDVDSGWLFTLYDAWVFQNDDIKNLHNAVWVPVDHKPLPPIVGQYFTRFNGVPVAMSKFGRDEFYSQDIEALYVPHGFDPVYEPKQRAEAREALGIPDDVFVVGMNAANKGKGGLHRKGFSQAFEGFARFHAKHPDSILYINAESTGMAGSVGWNLERLAVGYSIENAVRFVDQHAWRKTIPTDALPWMYSAFDVFLNPAYGEGFGVPIIEAQACGVPVVVTDHTAMSELVFDGWAVDGINMWHEQMAAFWKIPHPVFIADALTEAYERPRGVSKRAVEGVAPYRADRVFKDHFLPVLANLEERINPAAAA